MKRSKGFTLIEALIALVIFIIAAAGVLQVWQYASVRVLHIITDTDAFENARAAMDAILMNIQLADEITLVADADGMLDRLALTELNPDGFKHVYVFNYDADSETWERMYHRLDFNDNEFAARIAELRVIRSGDLLNIKISTDTTNGEAVILECNACIRNKILN